MDFPVNKDHFGLGYHSQNVKKLILNVVEGQILPLSEIFASSRHLIDWHIYAVEEEGVSVVDEEELVYKRMEGQELPNWTATETPEVTMFEK